jgi:Flp pilus assembly protein TadD
MAVSAIRKAPLAALLMLGAIAGPAHAGWFDSDPKPAKTDAKPDAKAAAKADAKDAALPATTLEDSIRQAQMLRLAGSYPEAVKHLSQLMLVASDDPRVISEYGKTLASMGRASDAVNFLNRAQQLQPTDWTVYSALGVAYDQIGDQKSAQVNYELALKLKPEEPSVLNNYALSRMLAKDPESARKLATRAEAAGGASDAMIGRNIAMVRSLAPEAPAQQVAQAPAPAPVAIAKATVPAPAPVGQTPAPAPVATAKATVPAPAPAPVASAKPPVASENRVVMQKVPVDPLAGPVATAAKPANAEVVATAAPRPLQAKPAEAALVPAPVKTAELKPVEAPAAKVAAPVKAVPVKSVPVKFTQPAPLTAAKVAFAPIKIAEPAPVATSNAPAPGAKPAAPAPVATAKAAAPATPVAAPASIAKAAAPVKAAEAPAASVTVKMTAPVQAAGKAEAAPKVLASAPVKDAKPVVKTAGQTKDAIPGLRLSANAY